MTNVEKSEILHTWHVCDVENVAINAKFMQFSPQFMRFHVEKNWAQKYICGEKMTNIRSEEYIYDIMLIDYQIKLT